MDANKLLEASKRRAAAKASKESAHAEAAQVRPATARRGHTAPEGHAGSSSQFYDPPCGGLLTGLASSEVEVLEETTVALQSKKRKRGHSKSSGLELGHAHPYHQPDFDVTVMNRLHTPKNLMLPEIDYARGLSADQWMLEMTRISLWQKLMWEAGEAKFIELCKAEDELKSLKGDVERLPRVRQLKEEIGGLVAKCEVAVAEMEHAKKDNDDLTSKLEASVEEKFVVLAERNSLEEEMVRLKDEIADMRKKLEEVESAAARSYLQGPPSPDAVKSWLAEPEGKEFMAAWLESADAEELIYDKSSESLDLRMKIGIS